MTSLDLALDIAQFATLFILSVANGVIAYFAFKTQKDRNTPKLVVYMELVEEEDREYPGLYVQNVGLVSALNVHIVVDIEEWRDGRPVKSRFHEDHDEFVDRHIALKPQEHRLYELPWMEGWSLVVTAVVSCGNGPSNNTHFVLGDDRSAIREFAFNKDKKRAIRRLKSRKASRMREPRGMLFGLGLNSLKDYNEMFGDKMESP